MYGKTIGKKFYEDGRVRTYPGNTVVADVTPECSAYGAMTHLRDMVADAGMEEYVILLPSDSYHMTVISGLNDQLRVDTNWPANLPKTTPMDQVDDYVSSAVNRVGLPGPARMKFDKIAFGATCMIVQLLAADESQERILRDFRERVAEEVGVKLPGHDQYRFHISLGYTLIVPEGEAAERMAKLQAQMDEYIAGQPEFTTGAPYMAYFNDMMNYSPVRLQR